MSKTNIYAFLCLALALEELKVDNKGGMVLNKEQLDKIEAEFKKLQDVKAEKDAAVTALSDATKAMNELGTTVEAAADPVKKVEAIRILLAAKPGAPAAGVQTKSDGTHKTIEGADPVTAYAQSVV